MADRSAGECPAMGDDGEALGSPPIWIQTGGHGRLAPDDEVVIIRKVAPPAVVAARLDSDSGCRPILLWPARRLRPMDLAPRRRAFAAVSLIVVVVAACSTSPAGASPSSADAGGAASTVQVNLQEWAVVPAAVTAPAGGITFQVTNTGPADVHEFVVLKTDLEPGGLPVDETGTVTEAGGGIEVIDEIEDIPVGETQDLSVTLAAGKYVLLCNIYSETEKEAHYKMGMYIGFTVTE